MCISIWYLFFSFWLTSLCVTCSRFIYHSRTDSNAFLFMTEKYSAVYMYHRFFIHSSVDGHLGCFHVLAIVNSAWCQSCVRFPVQPGLGTVVSSFLTARDTTYKSLIRLRRVEVPLRIAACNIFLQDIEGKIAWDSSFPFLPPDTVGDKQSWGRETILFLLITTLWVYVLKINL